MTVRNVLDIDDLEPSDVARILDLAEVTSPSRALEGKGVALLFEKPSARTRNSAEMAVVQLGGHPVTIRGEEVGIASGRETPGDVALTLSCYHALIGARVFDHAVMEEMATALAKGERDTPIINLLSDTAHPCQALADLLTVRQAKGDLAGTSLAYVGDANNVCRSLALGAVMSGMDFRVATPEGYALPEGDVSRVEDAARRAGLGGTVHIYRDPIEAVRGAEVVYTDVWTSMGQEDERADRREAFRDYQVNASLMSRAADDAVFLHCLPAHRGEEVSGEVIDGAQSVVWRQAENRMHAMRGLFLWMFA